MSFSNFSPTLDSLFHERMSNKFNPYPITKQSQEIGLKVTQEEDNCHIRLVVPIAFHT